MGTIVSWAPHGRAEFTDALPAGLMAETRSDRIAQFHEVSSVPVLGLYEGSWVRVASEQRTIGGSTGAVMLIRAAVTDLELGA